MADGTKGKRRTGSELTDVLDSLDLLLAKLKRIGALHAGELDRNERERLTRSLEDMVVESKRLLETFGVRCGYCRTAPAEMVGQCAKCGGDACTNCATAYEGVILHKGTCAAFYGSTPE